MRLPGQLERDGLRHVRRSRCEYRNILRGPGRAEVAVPRGPPSGPKHVRIDSPRSSDRDRRGSLSSSARWPPGGRACCSSRAGAARAERSVRSGVRSASPITVDTLGARLWVAARTISSICAGDRVIEMESCDVVGHMHDVGRLFRQLSASRVSDAIRSGAPSVPRDGAARVARGPARRASAPLRATLVVHQPQAAARLALLEHRRVSEGPQPERHAQVVAHRDALAPGGAHALVQLLGRHR